MDWVDCMDGMGWNGNENDDCCNCTALAGNLGEHENKCRLKEGGD